MSNRLLLGCIADDLTGATDLSIHLVGGGMRVLQTIGVPTGPVTDDVDAVVVGLKSRTLPAGEAVTQSLAALQWLQSHDVGQVYFKYCSTFDSTDSGNIGPVTDALMTALGCDFTVACPAFPEAGRTVFKGHLFVGDLLLQESGMRNHPLTPMTDSNLVRVLQRQTSSKVGLLGLGSVRQGMDGLRQSIQRLRADGVRVAIVDAIELDDLGAIGRAMAGCRLVTGASALASGLTQNFAVEPRPLESFATASGTSAVIAGSCSAMTNAQVAHFKQAGHQAYGIDPFKLGEGNEQLVGDVLDWAASRSGDGPLLVYATAQPQELHRVQEQLGAENAGHLVEQALAAIAVGLVRQGVGRLVIAGGETSGACVEALGVQTMRIGPQISPGVPWCHARVPHGPTGNLHLALKSGNFGEQDFFTRAFAVLECDRP